MRGNPRRLTSFLAATCAALAGSCSDDVGLVDAPQLIDAGDPGRFQVSWTLGHDGTPLTCADVNGSSVTIEVIEQGVFGGIVELFSCTSAMGTSRPLKPGRYDLRLTLTGSGGQLAGPIARIGVDIVSNQTAAVEAVAFDVDPTGTLVFRLTTAMDSCAAAPGGAGITATRIALRDAAGTCIPTTFEISAGATSGRPAGTYASDCAAATYGCIADDQDVTATAVRAGQRSIVITGLVGAAACWNRTSSFTARAAGLTTSLGALALVRDTVACP